MYFLVTFCAYGFFSKSTQLLWMIYISVPNMWWWRACLTHAHSLYAGLTGIWCLEMKHDHRSWLTKPPPASAHTHMFADYDVSLWPTTALTASLITDVSYCHVGWIVSSFASSGLLWMTELCNKSCLFFQT
jgi:hypothetical protein